MRLLASETKLMLPENDLSKYRSGQKYHNWVRVRDMLVDQMAILFLLTEVLKSI